MHVARLVLAFHNHQPTGNFDGVFEAAYQDSYRPFLEILAGYPQIPISLHTSGCLMEWLVERHPEYIDLLRSLVARGQVEIVGGGFYEPILPMIPPADRRGQIADYTNYLQELFDAKVRGIWVPERVWEQSLVTDIAAAGIDYTVLDDFHFKCAGLGDDELFGYFIAEDAGHLIMIFPGSERLRYTIPFADPGETIAHARRAAEEHGEALLVFADDGEKFGTWPETKKHVYEDGWLRRFFDTLVANAEWLKLITFAQAVDQTPPAGKIYLPDSSYREMTEWALPARQLVEYHELAHELEHDGRWPRLRRFVRGGFWRNFKVKYPESDDMYCRMLEVSGRLEALASESAADELAADATGDDTTTIDPTRAEALRVARQELFRGQCNCSYWHGAFGGLYLPHLRNAVYAHLIAADSALDRAEGRVGPWVESHAADLNRDARQEVRLANDKLVAYFAPAQGGQLYEFDVRAVPINLLATLSRRPEAYHEKIKRAAGQSGGNGSVASIHDRVVFKQPGLDQKLIYDTYRRRSLIDHFFAPDVTLADAVAGRAAEHGDFVAGVYKSRLRRSPDRDRVTLVMTRDGVVGGFGIRVAKTIALSQDNPAIEIRYTLEDLPKGFPFLFAVELGFAGMAGNAPDRFFYTAAERHLGPLESQLELAETDLVGLVDGWLGLDVALSLSRAATVWTFPIQAVSQSEGGFELVHQSSTVVPLWPVCADARGRWSVELTLALDTSAAEAKNKQDVLV